MVRKAIVRRASCLTWRARILPPGKNARSLNASSHFRCPLMGASVLSAWLEAEALRQAGCPPPRSLFSG